jgi:hypothetical protein
LNRQGRQERQVKNKIKMTTFGSLPFLLFDFDFLCVLGVLGGSISDIS